MVNEMASNGERNRELALAIKAEIKRMKAGLPTLARGDVVVIRGSDYLAKVVRYLGFSSDHPRFRVKVTSGRYAGHLFTVRHCDLESVNCSA